jgi:hypothetical protein
MPDPNLVTSGLSKIVPYEGDHLRIEIYRLEHQTQWTLEVVDKEGTSIVWDDLFDSDIEAHDEAIKAIEEEGRSAFGASGNVIRFPR